MIRLATDVGGTFTDLIAYDDTSGAVVFSKSLTTVDDQSVGVLDTIAMAERSGLGVDAIGFFVHGGTTVINAITERKGVKTALITTAGFRDVLEIGRGNRPDLYNLRTRTPAPFVPRHLRFEVRERMSASGEVLHTLDQEDVARCARQCREQQVAAVAIIFLHSYANPAHEKQCAELLRKELPGISVCASHEISRQWREYERSNTVALNAYVQPIIRNYFDNLGTALERKGINCPTYAMQSNGGVASFEQVVTAPLTLVESGPSGGVAGAARIGSEIGETDILYLDVGGTTAKCSLIKAGQPKVDAEYRLEKTRSSPGYTIQVPVVDIVEVGAGGGSIAWLDSSGRLRVGPQSAGSNPGPACYGRGGADPTVTDAKLALGILDPLTFADGRMPLDVDRARAAIARVSLPMKLPVEQAALAIVKVTEESMINALKLITIQRGHDPRDLVLIVSGGAGPLLAASLGRELNAKRTVIPTHPGIFSAWGMLAARPRADIRRTVLKTVSEHEMDSIAQLFAELEQEAIEYFAGTSTARLKFHHYAEMRYRGQEHSVSVTISGGSAEELLSSFHATHQKAFSFALMTATAEITTLHLQTEMLSEVIALPKIQGNPQDTLDNALKGQRFIFLARENDWVACNVYDRNLLPIGSLTPGPALVEEATTTTFVPPDQMFTRDETGQLVVRGHAPMTGSESGAA
ncbi:hydantoinase/oxoprolinase family protein [Bradyrhizobium liaoningense]|uniref:hydantoinase/oxoprolinase family protein n=1 Tax=Bradyrhizobium liaoningense TaxID=43992 RepID=UPI001BA54C25|nr:hydantoinase/oxoprolinase family protein [Bradyrhizobium liaoningense]MBR0706689.1 hydantoinase/oxoprolinase family protein [Bradyrhizobium liaoningense]